MSRAAATDRLHRQVGHLAAADRRQRASAVQATALHQRQFLRLLPQHRCQIAMATMMMQTRQASPKLPSHLVTPRRMRGIDSRIMRVEPHPQLKAQASLQV